MGYSLGISTSESQNPGSNQSTVYVTGTLYTGGNSYSGYSTSYSVVIGGMTVASGAGPTALWNPDSWSFSGSYTYTHDANGYRGAVGTAVYFSGSGGYSPGSLGTGGTTYGAIDYDRKPAAPSTVTAVLNADRTITVTSNAVSSPAGTATYYLQSSSNGGSSWSSETTISGNARTYTYGVNALAPGGTYLFRMRASNSDGYSGYTNSNSLFYPSSGKRFDGSTFQQMVTAKRFDGSGWADIATAKRYNGTDWINLS